MTFKCCHCGYFRLCICFIDHFSHLVIVAKLFGGNSKWKLMPQWVGVCVCVDFQWKLNSLIIKNLQKLSIAFNILWHQLIVLKNFCNFIIFSLKKHVFRTEIRGHCILMHKIVIKSNGILQNHGALWRCNLLNFLL